MKRNVAELCLDVSFIELKKAGAIQHCTESSSPSMCMQIKYRFYFFENDINLTKFRSLVPLIENAEPSSSLRTAILETCHRLAFEMTAKR